MYVEIKNLTKYYGEGKARKNILDCINAEINEGEICVIMGPSGSGKSTFLNCVGGLEKIDAGEVIIDGLDISKLSSKKLTEFRRKSVGFVFQFYNLIPDLSLSGNVDVCAYLADKPLDREELLKKLGLNEIRKNFPNTMSGGEQQRCSIARALVKNPKLLLCDEPTGALDSKTAKEILCLFEKINREYGTTILIVTHNASIKSMADHIISIHDGRVVQDYYNEKKIKAENLEDI